MKKHPAKLATSVALLSIIAVGVSACCGDGDSAQLPGSIVLQLVDERGAALSAGSYRLGEKVYQADGSGRIMIRSIDRPRMGLVVAPSKIVEPVAIGRGDRGRTIVVELLDQKENRWTFHAGGDAMFGRRYVAPDEGEPLIDPNDDGESAVKLVSHFSEVFAAADFRTVNLETVVGDLPDSSLYPGKRWILISPENSLAALEAMSIDRTIIANNHLRDYLDDGVRSTIDALDQRQLAYVGGGETLEESQQATFIDVKGIRVGMHAYTTVDGDFVNDSYPSDSATEPAVVAEVDQWLWEFRTWGFSAGGIDIPAAERRIGGAWKEYAAVEADADDAVSAEVYASLIAVYPEMQDWVARRGHGGSARFISDISPGYIAQTAAEADVTIVQLHSGFQFSHSPSGGVHQNARAAIDAGADMVVCHHPHVLQGVEYYRGKLIVWSLGNFIFDQNFLSTFNTMMLRTVWEGDQLIQTRLLPMQLEAYIPVFSTDEAADLVLSDVWRKSLQETICERGEGSRIYAVGAELDSDTVLPRFTFERHTARVEPGLPQVTTRTMALAPGEIRELPVCAAVSRRVGETPPEGLQLGIELFGWGHFEDADTDDQLLDMTHWAYDERDDRKIVTGGCRSGESCLEMGRTTTNESNLIIRPVARVPLYSHRIYRRNGETLEPADGPWQLMVRLFAKATAQHDGHIRLTLYHFNDLDPTVAPSTTKIREIELPLEHPADGKWHEIRLVPTAQEMESSIPGEPVNFLMPYIVLPPAAYGSDVVLRIDDLSLIEWREAAEQPEGYGVYQQIRNSSDQSLEVELELLDGCQ